ncbi:hypothetical protein VWZ88_18295 [Phaeobacter sp. JH20_36]|uniref:hypothetical protein n=1 Tax=unclassified Phaeobacter TaxID=2621772 RepID=UPI003A874AF9
MGATAHLKARESVYPKPAVRVAGTASWLPLGFIIAVALLAGCAGPGHYPLTGHDANVADPVHSMSMTQGAMVAGGL